jgi:hypothetical protein
MEPIRKEYAMKIEILISIIVLCFWVNLFAQSPDTIWSKVHGITIDIDEGRCIRNTADGGYIITGSCVPNGLISHTDLLLCKTDVSGNIIWSKTYGRTLIEEGFSVEQTTDGGYIITGRSLTGTYPYWDPVYSNAWLLKTDANGDTAWTKIYGGNGNDYCTSIQQTADLGYIMTGTMNSEGNYPDYEIDEEYEPDSSKAWLIKTDSAGDTLWTRTYRERSYGNCVLQTSDGGYILVGWMFPDDHEKQSDVLLIKTDSSGNTVWTKNIGAEDNDAGFCIRQTADGYIIAGQTKPTGLPYSALIIKTDLSGKMLWSKTFAGETSNMAFSIEISQDGYFVTGITNGNWWAHQGDMWAFEIDTEGNLLWERIFKIRLSDYAFCGIITSDGGFVVTGMTSTGFGGDLWLAKLGQIPTGIRENNPIIRGILLKQNYPNPFNPTTMINYQLPMSSEVELSVYNLLGQKIATLVSERQPAGTYTVKWSAFQSAGIASGVYLYRLEAGEYIVTRKMILMK